jgi:hypothetical protein
MARPAGVGLAMGMPQELHVMPDVTRGGWVLDGAWYATLGEAEKAAAALAAPVVFVHDRYHRVRTLVTA